MVIIKGNCKICNEYFRENGEDNFNNSVLPHYSTKHQKEWNEYKELVKKANEELSELKSRYPELMLFFGGFEIKKETFVTRGD